MGRFSYWGGMVFCLILCFLLQAVAGHLAQSGKGESNYFSSMARLERAVEPAQAMILGSSLTGRLPDRALGIAGWCNVGIDGGSAVDGLMALDEGLLPLPRLIVIEANSLSVSLSKRQSDLLEAIRSPWFRWKSRIPSLSAGSRPSSMCYAVLMGLKQQNAQMKLPAYQVSTVPQLLSSEASSEPNVKSVSPEQRILMTEMSKLISRLKQRGCHLCIVWLPPARSKEQAAAGWIEQFAMDNQIPWWDLGRSVPAEQVFLTDGIHMRVDSAWRTMKTMEVVLDSCDKIIYQ